MNLALPAACAAALCVFGGAAHAASYNTPITFSQSGTVSATLEVSDGGFDHLLEVLDGISAITVMALTVPGGSPDVLGLPPTPVGGTVAVGAYTAGSELSLRLTNVGSTRFGDIGVIDSYVYTGSSSGLNPQPSMYYTRVEELSPTSVRVTFEDVFPANPASPTVDADFGAGDVTLTFNLSPVPEPQTWALASLGLLAVAWGTRRRA